MVHGFVRKYRYSILKGCPSQNMMLGQINDDSLFTQLYDFYRVFAISRLSSLHIFNLTHFYLLGLSNLGQGVVIQDWFQFLANNRQ